jgi:phage shock protein C
MVRVYRSQTDKKIAGLCGGLAEAYRVDANVMRLGFVFLGVATGVLPLLVAYVVGWILIPFRPSADTPAR